MLFLFIYFLHFFKLFVYFLLVSLVQELTWKGFVSSEWVLYFMFDWHQLFPYVFGAKAKSNIIYHEITYKNLNL